METPSARGIIIFANEDDIRWDRWHVPSPCLPEALLQGPASSLTRPPPPRMAFLFFPLSHPTHFSSCPPKMSQAWSGRRYAKPTQGNCTRIGVCFWNSKWGRETWADLGAEKNKLEGAPGEVHGYQQEAVALGLSPVWLRGSRRLCRQGSPSSR